MLIRAWLEPDVAETSPCRARQADLVAGLVIAVFPADPFPTPVRRQRKTRDTNAGRHRTHDGPNGSRKGFIEGFR